eukprot:CAMPEP_0118632844 /NCGR_PEP_ID=MMETSP0785-20121206/670_1 /TAXON_ID=91992 /ORGANISM="Bolidomonas pacifica, Strain CCMP 1866" /LENGTH=360 /DNA_ID=CAMNT_0006523659 /DNA_START=119 /DNA_END=1198 /DNA_ORIENTATION=-
MPATQQQRNYALTPTSASFLEKKRTGEAISNGNTHLRRNGGNWTRKMLKSASSSKVLGSHGGKGGSGGGCGGKNREEESRARARRNWKKAGNLAIAMKRFERSGKEAQRRKQKQQEGGGGGGVRSRSTTPTNGKKAAMNMGIKTIRVSPKGGGEEADRVKKARGAMQNNPGPQVKDGTFSSRGVHNVRWKEKLRGLSLVTNNIALGGRDEANNKEMLLKYGITHVLNTCKQLKNFFPDSFTYLKINAIDDPRYDISKDFQAAGAFLTHVEKVKGRVLVHCIAGVSRSVCCVLMHLIRNHKVCLNQAYRHIKNVRPFIHPNEGFLYQMAMFEVESFGWTSCGGGGAHRDFKFYKWAMEKKK